MNRETLDEYSETVIKRRTLEREVKTLKDREKQLVDLIAKHLNAVKTDSMSCFGYRIGWIPARATVSWATVFLKAFGKARVNEIKQAAGFRKTISVVREEANE